MFKTKKKAIFLAFFQKNKYLARPDPFGERVCTENYVAFEAVFFHSPSLTFIFEIATELIKTYPARPLVKRPPSTDIDGLTSNTSRLFRGQINRDGCHFFGFDNSML